MINYRLGSLCVLLLFFFNNHSQSNINYSALSISNELKENANAVVRYDNTTIEIYSHNKMVHKTQRAITILNSNGDKSIGAYVFYDNTTSIDKLKATIYDQFGKEIKKIKKKDFRDQSAVSGGTLYSDDRVKYINYTPINYPYTVVFEAEITYTTTAFIPSWRPIEGFYTSTESASYKIVNTSQIEVKTKTLNFENYNINKIDDLYYKATKLHALVREAHSPDFRSYAPFLLAALTEFDMKGVRGINTNWANFGKWINDNLLNDTIELPTSVIEEVKALTVDAKTQIEKAKIVYQYMQDRTRYISVQIGIGGWKPIDATDVDRLGYGDCKGLSNYTRALLKEVGVPSYYTVIYGGSAIRHLDKEFSRTEGNHAILAIPQDDAYIWLECTSQTNPFGYIANFTDDRDALVITPEGGKIVRTKAYDTQENIQRTTATIHLNLDGSFSADVNIEAQGSQYGYHQYIEQKDLKNQKLHYKEYWDNINNINIMSIDLDNDKDKIIYTEKIALSALKYAKKSGDLLLLKPNAFNNQSYIPRKYKNRKRSFSIPRGYVDVDEYIIHLDKNLAIETLQDDVVYENKFGKYSFSIHRINDYKLKFKRKLVINKGNYPKDDYFDYRAFRSDITKHDNSKIVLKIK